MIRGRIFHRSNNNAHKQNNNSHNYGYHSGYNQGAWGTTGYPHPNPNYWGTASYPHPNPNPILNRPRRAPLLPTPNPNHIQFRAGNSQQRARHYYDPNPDPNPNPNEGGPTRSLNPDFG